MTMTPGQALSFFRSVIRSGEPWTSHCDIVYEQAMAHLAQPAQGRGEAVVGAKGKFISESGYCFSGTLDSVLYKVWLNDGSLVTIGRDEFILDANPTRSSPAVAPDDERLHSGSAEDVAQWLYANGHHDAAFTVRQQLDVRNERIRALESTHLTQPAQAVDMGAIREVIAWMEDNACGEVAGITEQIDKLTRALAGEKAEGWRPIATAPKDGTSILVSDGRPEGCLVVAWHYGGWVYDWHRHDGPALADAPTHWMPLPAPPEVTP